MNSIHRLAMLAALTLAAILPCNQTLAQTVVVHTAYTLGYKYHPVFIVPGETDPALNGYVPPVFAAKPLKPVQYGIYVDAKGDCVGIMHGKSPEEIELSTCLKNSTFIGATVGNVKTCGYLRTKARIFFYVDETTNGLETLPASRFRLDYAAIDTYLCMLPREKNENAEELGEAARVYIHFKVDEKGHVTSMSADDDNGRDAIKKLFEPIKQSLIFSPAVKGGKTVPVSLSLALIPESAKSKAEIPASSEPQSLELPTLKQAYAGPEARVAKCYMTFNADGAVGSIRMSPTIDKDDAIQIMGNLRKWSCPITIPAETDIPVVAMALKFTPASSEIAIEEPCHLVGINYPDMPKVEGTSLRNLPIFKTMTATLSWKVNQMGQVMDAHVDSASNPTLDNRLGGIMKRMKTSHVCSFDGREETFVVFCPSLFRIYKEDTKVYR